MMKNLRIPLLLLLIQIAAMAYMIATGDSYATVTDPDSGTYSRFFSFVTGSGIEWVRSLLLNVRTPGYPALLGVISFVSPSGDDIALWQYLTVACAVSMLFFALVRFGFSPFMALAAVSPILYSSVVLEFCKHILSDVPGIAAMLIATACLLLHVAAPHRRIYRAALFLSVFLAFITRPLYQYLVVLLPLLAVPLAMLRNHGLGLPQATAKQLALLFLRALAITAAPFVLWCGLRLALVGNFAVVAFAGTNLMGIGGQLITPEIENRFPPAERAFVRELIVTRREMGLPEGFAPYVPKRDFTVYSEQFDKIVYGVVPVVLTKLRDSGDPDFRARLYPDGGTQPDAIELEKFLGGIASRAIRLKFDSYLHIMHDSMAIGLSARISKTLLENTIFQIAATIWLLAIFLLNLAGAARPVASTRPLWEFNVIFTLALAYTFVNSFLIVTIQIPAFRYIAPGTMFVVPSLVLLCVSLWARHIAAGRKHS